MLFKRLTVLLLLLLSGCGFHLQSALTTPAVMERTYLATENTHSQFYRELRSRLRAAGVILVESPAEATATLLILVDETDQRVLSVSARNVPTEYEVYYSVEYELFSGETSLLAPQMLTLTRDYTYNENLVLGKAREEAMMREIFVVSVITRQCKHLRSK